MLLQKRNSILFIDFNGVISYKKFWFSLDDDSHELSHINQPIETFLFEENIHIVKKWMNGGYTSEEVHDLIHVGLGKSFVKEELWEVFVNDCKNIDISRPIISMLKR